MEPASPPTPLNALPRANVLSYVATAESPTRVRQITGRALKILAALHLLPALFAFSMIIWNVIIDLREYYAPPSPPSRLWVILGGPPPAPPIRISLFEELHFIADQEMAWIIPFLLAATFAIVLHACVKPVARGKKVACIVSMAALAPLWIALFITALSLIGRALFDGLGIGQNRADPPYLLLFLPAAVALVLFMLLMDLMAYLRWIAKNPITEIPPTSFLPARPTSASQLVEKP